MATRPAGAGQRPSRVIDTGAVDVRPARMDRPLRQATLDPTYTDPHLEAIIRAAADQARQEARAEGYAAGWSQGRQAAGEQARAELATVAARAESDRVTAGRTMAQLLSTLGEAARAARATVMPDWSEVADTLAEGSIRLAAAILGRELDSVDDEVGQAVHAALQQLADPGEAVVHLNPADAALVLEDSSVKLRVISDPRVPAGSVTVLTPAQRLRYDLPGALAAAEAVLKA